MIMIRRSVSKFRFCVDEVGKARRAGWNVRGRKYNGSLLFDFRLSY